VQFSIYIMQITPPTNIYVSKGHFLGLAARELLLEVKLELVCGFVSSLCVFGNHAVICAS
jgi:hypothetical protein